MSEDLQDPRPKLLDSIDFSKCRVEFSKTPIVLLCGGYVPPLKLHPDDPDPSIKSLRDAISRASFPPFEIFRPEEINLWWKEFKDLITFEKDLASICSLVVIILESAGAIAELGAFSQLNDLSQKIMVVYSNKSYEEKSFISVGIIKFINKARDEACEKGYPWVINEPVEINEPLNITNDIINGVIADIKSEIEKLNSTEELKSDRSSHAMVLICELIYYFEALNESEIKSYLERADIKISIEELRGKLFLLEEFRLIKKIIFGVTFYKRTNEPYHRLSLSLKSKNKFDSLRFKIDCRVYYRSEKNKNRIRAIEHEEKGLNK
jgi:hypothetical protein